MVTFSIFLHLMFNKFHHLPTPQIRAYIVAPILKYTLLSVHMYMIAAYLHKNRMSYCGKGPV